MSVASPADALAFALVGERLELPVADAVGAMQFVPQLTRVGWPPQRIAAHAAAERAAGRPWPHPVDPAERGGLGPAQFHAALASLRQELGLDGLVAAPPSARTTLTADERRLLADAPPHSVQR